MRWRMVIREPKIGQFGDMLADIVIQRQFSLLRKQDDGCRGNCFDMLAT